MKENSRHPERSVPPSLNFHPPAFGGWAARGVEGSLLLSEAIAVIFSAAVLGVLCASAVKHLPLSLFLVLGRLAIP